MKRYNRLFPLFLILIFLASGCTKYIIKKPYGYNISRTFDAGYESTWSAVMETLEGHPIISTDRENGNIDTDWVAATTPLYIYRQTIPFLKREKAWNIGLSAAYITPGIVYAAYVIEGEPAHEAGIRSLDVLIDANGNPVKAPSDISRILKMRSATVTISVSRIGKIEPLTFHVSPKNITRGNAYTPVQTEYKLDVRVTKLAENSTEVNIFSIERGVFDLQTQQFVRSDGRLVGSPGSETGFQKVESSTFREKILLDTIQRHLSKQ